jgi:hypothetical protein
MMCDPAPAARHICRKSFRKKFSSVRSGIFPMSLLTELVFNGRHNYRDTAPMALNGKTTENQIKFFYRAGAFVVAGSKRTTVSSGRA